MGLCPGRHLNSFHRFTSWFAVYLLSVLPQDSANCFFSLKIMVAAPYTIGPAAV
jgi:hypothetical protein